MSITSGFDLLFPTVTIANSTPLKFLESWRYTVFNYFMQVETASVMNKFPHVGCMNDLILNLKSWNWNARLFAFSSFQMICVSVENTLALMPVVSLLRRRRFILSFSLYLVQFIFHGLEVSPARCRKMQLIFKLDDSPSSGCWQQMVIWSTHSWLSWVLTLYCFNSFDLPFSQVSSPYWCRGEKKC